MPRAKYRYQKKYKGIMIDVSAGSEAELEEKVRKRKNDIDAGEQLGGEAGTLVRVWAHKWLTTYKIHDVSTRNYEQYEANLRLHVLPSIGAKMLSDVRQYDLQEILNKKTKYSRSHIVHIKNAITGMFRSAYENGLIRVNPALNLKIPGKGNKYLAGPDAPAGGQASGHRSLTDKEAEQMLRHAGDHYAGTFFKIIYYTGLRPEEVCALTPASFELKKGKEAICVTAAIENRTRAVKMPKTKAGIRTVPIPEIFVPEIKEIVSVAKKEKKQFIFSTADGRPMDTDDAYRWWRFFRNYIDRKEGAKTARNKIVEHAFAEDLTPYDLRHNFCTNLQRAGVPLNVAKVLMGHETVETTAKIYTHHTEDMTDDARKKMTAFSALPNMPPKNKAPQKGTKETPSE